MDAHDELIPDKFYREGWEAYVSLHLRTGSEPEKGTPTLLYYLAVKDPDSTPVPSLLCGPPVKLPEVRADEDIGVEEIRCTVATLCEAYRYYISRVVSRPSRQTLLSICYRQLKSPCFEIQCFCSEAPDGPRRGVVFEEDGASVWVVGVSHRTLSVLLNSMCDIGITPIAPQECLYLVSSDLPHGTVGVNVGILSPPLVGGVEIAGKVRELGGEDSAVEAEGGGWPVHGWLRGRTLDGAVMAVRTATATVSVVLTPRSLHGGKNPETKEVLVVVHAVSLQSSAWNPAVVVPSVA